MFLAQSAVMVPDIAWSSFAPELLPTAAALVLLLVGVAGRRRLAVAATTGLAAVALGVWLIVGELVVPGAVAVVVGAALPALVIAFPRTPSMVQAWGAGLALVGALVLTMWQYATLLAPVAEGPMAVQAAMQGSVANDGIALFTRLTVYLTALLVVPMGYGYLRDRDLHRSEVEPLLLLATVGMAAVGTANDLISLFIALEVFNLALYVLAGWARRDRRSEESGLKYFVTSAVASAVLLYGMALVFVATGTVSLPEIGATLGLVTTPRGVAAVGLALMTVGIGYKVSLAPFHLWTADVYQGTPTNFTAFMAAATKAAGFAVILRLYLVAFPSLEALWVPVLSVLAAITMLYGAYAAIVQHDLKRILAFSSITHAGYATIGVVANSADGLSATLWYLLTYAVGTGAAFGALIALERRRRGEVTLGELRGLGREAPDLAAVLSLALLSLAGLPITAGFVGKLMVFRAGIDAGLTWLVVIGVVSSVVAAFFYLRIAAMMFLHEPATDRGRPIVSTGLSVTVSVAAVLVLYLGVQPQLFLDLAANAAALVR